MLDYSDKIIYVASMFPYDYFGATCVYKGFKKQGGEKR